MILRLLLVGSVLGVMVFMAAPLTGNEAAFQAATAAAAPANTYTNGIQFSTGVGSDARPNNPKTEFDGSTHSVWASFEFFDHTPGAKLTYLVRANGEDYKWGDLDCCSSSSGRFAFPITKKNGNGDLPGAAYEVRIFTNNAEIAVGGFGVNGRGGLDNDGGGNGNDNN